jgi:hypothetical protein
LVSVPVFFAVALVFWSFGDRLLRWARFRIDDAAGRFALSVALSYGALSLFVFLLAIVQAVTFASCLLLLAGMAGVSFPQLWTNLQALFRGIRGVQWGGMLRPRGGWEAWAAWLAGLIVCLGAVQALAPPTGLDTGRIHFTAAKLMVRAHGLSPEPGVWFHRIGGFHLVYLFGMSLLGEGLAKLLAFGVSPVALLLAASASDRLRPGSGRAAAFIVASSPLFSNFTGYEFLELPVLLYLLASILSFLCFRAGGGAGSAAAAGAFAGLALGVKVSAFPVLILLPPMALAAVRSRAWGALGTGTAAFAVTGGFWPLWNRVTTGSFIYRAYLESNAEGAAAQAPHWATGVLTALGSIATASDYWSDSAGPFVMAAVAAVWILNGPAESRPPAALFLASVPFYLGVIALRAQYYFLFDAHGRYLGPFLLGFGALAAGPLICWGESGPRYLRAVLLAALFLPVLPLLALKAGKTAVAAPAAFGLESRSRYLSKKIETFEACEILNGLPQPDVKVCFLAQRPYYLDRPFVHIEILDGTRGREDLIRRLREAGCTHVVVEPETVTTGWMKDADGVFDAAPFRELRRWPWKQKGFVRLFAVDRP